MRTILSILTVFVLLAPAGLAMAHHSDQHTTGNGNSRDSMPDAALFGLCTAWAHNENGRENGNAGNAGPFVWLQTQAEESDQAVEEYCENVQPGLP